MALIRQAVQDILTLCSQIPVVNQDAQNVTAYTRVWNNQLTQEMEGQLYDFPKPAIFIELVIPVAYEAIGQGYRSADIGVRAHLIREHYNEDGTFEQDLNIYDLRDSVISALHLFCPTGCGPLVAMSEEQDYEHKNITHYVIEFMCHFIDEAGNVEKNFQIKEPDTNAQIDGTFS